MRRTAWLPLLVLVVACLHVDRRQTSVTVAHSSGGPAPIMTFVTVHADGHIELQEGGARSHAYVRPIEATQIIDRLRGLEKQLETLRPLAEEYGCCDHEEVWAKTSTIEITLPVSYAQVIATTPKLVVEEHYPVPDDLYGVFSALESLVIRAFHRRPSFTLVPRGAG